MAAQSNFLSQLKHSIQESTFVKLTLSKTIHPDDELKNIYVRKIELKNEPHLSFTFHYKTKDETRNYSLDGGQEEVQSLINHTFKNATLFTTEKTYTLLTSKKGKKSLTHSKSSSTPITSPSHDRKKVKRAKPNASYLQLLGIVDQAGQVIPKMADKYRQINKFLEVMDGLIEQISHKPETLRIVDMGSGKGYLTFALYDFLVNTKKLKAQVKGIEIRQGLVYQCNDVAKKCSFEDLSFDNRSIDDFEEKEIDILIALHACDTATDDALAKGLKAKAELIVCAPCCHKQVRQQLKGKEQNSPILKYGIFKERQFEMVTDTIRALILEKEGYESKVFEFVSNEHTRKNVMLVGINHHKPNPQSSEKIDSIKKAYNIEFQQLEKLV
ncbi:MAG: SAM-dependent methyltransferase [Reichenbachiella sp.]